MPTARNRIWRRSALSYDLGNVSEIFEQDAENDNEDGAPTKSLTHMTSVHKRQVVLKKGDVVRVKTGELKDLLGDVDSIFGKVFSSPRPPPYSGLFEIK